MNNVFKHLSLLLCLLAAGQTLNAQYNGIPIPMNNKVSVDAAGKELKWEEGNHDYFIMHKTLVSRNEGSPFATDSAGNPQGNGLIAEATGSTYQLKAEHLPSDAVVDAAYLIWTADVSLSDCNAAMDNAVTLKFTHKDAKFTLDPFTVTASRAGKLTSNATASGDKAQTFEFEGFKTNDACDPGLDQGAYTYRVEITSFFDSILQKGRESGITADGEALLGSYNLSGVKPFDVAYYAQNSAMIGNWAILLIYSSSAPGMKPKKIYVYNGLRMYVNEESTIAVSGFTFPKDPSIRASLMVNEGDSGRQDSTQSKIPEGLFFQGAGTAWESLANACNPEKTKDQKGNNFNYTEMFNSISSFFSWNQYENPVCIGGQGGNSPTPDTASMEWGIDVDTFVFNAAKYPSQLVEGGNKLSFKIGANSDDAITNLLVVSVDTKPVAFDIPGKEEKTSCSCAGKEGFFCTDSAFFYLIRVQNWGQANASAVTVTDKLPAEVKYISNTTEIATKFDAEGRGLDWKPVPDGSGGAFPLEGGYKVADSLKTCNASTGTCEESVLLRFKVQPQEGLPKHAVAINSATISDASGVLYKSNSNVPLRLRFGECTAGCVEPDLATAACGGLPATAECTKKEDCSGELICVNGHCVEAAADNEPSSDDDSSTVSDSKKSDSAAIPDTDGMILDEESGCGCTLLPL